MIVSERLGPLPAMRWITVRARSVDRHFF